MRQGKGMGWVYEEEGQPAPQRGKGGGLPHKSERGSLSFPLVVLIADFGLN